MTVQREKREARRKIKKLLTLLTYKEKRALRKARERAPHEIRRKTLTCPGIKQWILKNKPARIGTMYQRNLLTRVSNSKK